MSDPHHARYSLTYDDEDRARVIERSLAGEIGEIDDDRSRTTLAREASTLTIEVEAADHVALRAATNTWLSLAGVVERVAESGDF